MRNQINEILVTVILLVIMSFGTQCLAQDSLWQRKYSFGFYNNYDLRNSSENAISTHRVLNDGFEKYIASKMNPKMGNISHGLFSFATTYLTMLWSHEFGHAIQAKQVGGKFNIHDVDLPVPNTTADLPDNISLLNEARFVSAGFEVNYLSVRKLQSQYIRQDGNWNTDLSLAFANRLMYPIYTTFVVRSNPEERNVWIETAGDPVHYILPVFKNYSNNQVFLPDSTVNPELVDLYNHANIFATFFHLLDPHFYREVGASFGNASKIRKPIFLIGDHGHGWTYGTLFNASPLGYELYMQNYIHINNRQYGLYLRYGRPFQNIGLGISMNDLVHINQFKSDLMLEFWDQDIFGKGISGEIIGEWKLNEYIGLQVNLGYKTEGYVLGKQLKAGFNLGIGFCFYNNSKK